MNEITTVFIESNFKEVFEKKLNQTLDDLQNNIYEIKDIKYQFNYNVGCVHIYTALIICINKEDI